MARASALPLLLLSLTLSTPPGFAQDSASPSIPDWSLESDVNGEQLGSWVSAAGDVNGDGFDDFLVSATGAVHLFPGSSAGPGQSPAWTQTGTGLRAHAPAGDVNGDGYDDILLSDGRLYMGSADGPMAAPVATGITSRIAAGDVNGDGRADIVAENGNGVNVYHGSPSGLPPAPTYVFTMVRLSGGSGRGPVVEDVTGDGYQDLVLTSWDWPKQPWDPSIGSSSLHMYKGGPSGLSQREMRVPKLPGGEAHAALAGAGDADGDGHADLITGLVCDGAGSCAHPLPVLAYYGSNSGLRSNATTVAAGPLILDGEGAWGSGGRAGDVDGDGYDDVLVGRLDTTEPRPRRVLQVFFGSAAGIAAGPMELRGVAPTSDYDDLFADSACGAGDVNGDGYDDILIGSPLFHSFGQVAEGRVSLFYGGPERAAARAENGSDQGRPDPLR